MITFAFYAMRSNINAISSHLQLMRYRINSKCDANAYAVQIKMHRIYIRSAPIHLDTIDESIAYEAKAIDAIALHRSLHHLRHL